MERESKGLAIVIRSTKIRERDRLLTLFSPSMGIVNVVSYGARKSIRCVKALDESRFNGRELFIDALNDGFIIL